MHKMWMELWGWKSLYKVYMVSFWNEPLLIFWIFTKETFVKRKRVGKNVLMNKKNFEDI